MRKRIAVLIGAACMALVAAAPAQAEFGFADVNTGLAGDPDAPAFAPATKALWAGTCDLSSASTSNGGVGSAPSLRGHCIDVGGSSMGEPPDSDSPWPAGQEPSWRLDPVTEAGAHPDASASFWFNYLKGVAGIGNPEGGVKNVIVKLPPGVVGNPEATPKCSAIAAQSTPAACPASSQVGVTTLGFGFGTAGSGASEVWNYQTKPVYNIEARDTVTAEFVVSDIATYFNVPITARGRTNGDYGVDTLALLIPELVPIGGQAFTLWGVPWAAEHDKFRVESANAKTAFPPGAATQGVIATGIQPQFRTPYDPSWGPIKPFFMNPTSCPGESAPLPVEIDSWKNPVSQGGSYEVAVIDTEPITDCENVEFDPSMTLRPDVAVADSPSGLDVLLTVPQNNDPPEGVAFDPADDTGAPAYWKTPAGRATAHLKDTVVKLPAGTSFNPAAANGLRGCTTAQIGLTALAPKVTFNNDPNQCPDTSKIGTLEIVSPLLDGPLEGAVYAAPQHDNPFPGTLTAIYLVSEDVERGLTIKLAGRVDLDPKTGQISTTFVDNPQLPFETFELHFKTGPRAPLNTPATCGQFKNSSTLTPWSAPHSGPAALIEDPFDIAKTPNGQACVTEPEDRQFAPGFEAGTTATQAGGETDFVLNVTRKDGDQELAGITLRMPPGLVAKLAGTPNCPDATLAAIEHSRTGLAESQGSLCPAASELGVVNSLAGAGSLPLPTAGKIYLAGPYDGAPLSVAAIVPAMAGGIPGQPSFDLGNVVVRSGVHVDPKSAQVTVKSTPLPYIVGGVPLRVRRISVDITKPGFMLNPTNCSEMSADGTLTGAGDPLAAGDEPQAGVSNRFQVGGCEALGFKPALSLQLFGGTTRAKYQAVRAVLRPRPGDANISGAVVRFPKSAFVAQEHLQNICTRVQWAADACPRNSVYGTAEAITPLLDEPLKGTVHLRSSDNLLPDLVADLRGPAHRPIKVEVAIKNDSVKGALRNTVQVAPDAPVTLFRLRTFGGSKGLIVNSENICKAKNAARVTTFAHNGRSSVQSVPVRNAKCAKQKRAGKAKAKPGARKGKAGSGR